MSPDLRLWLTSNGFDGESADCQRGGWTPLLRASGQGKTEVVRELIAEGAQLNATSPDGNNAVWLAAAAHNLDCVTLLAASGVDINHRNPDGATALIYAASSGKDEVIALLLRLGADPSPETIDGFTALDLASTPRCLRLLLSEDRQGGRDAP